MANVFYPVLALQGDGGEAQWHCKCWLSSPELRFCARELFENSATVSAKDRWHMRLKDALQVLQPYLEVFGWNLETEYIPSRRQQRIVQRTISDGAREEPQWSARLFFLYLAWASGSSSTRRTRRDWAAAVLQAFINKLPADSVPCLRREWRAPFADLCGGWKDLGGFCQHVRRNEQLSNGPAKGNRMRLYAVLSGLTVEALRCPTCAAWLVRSLDAVAHVFADEDVLRSMGPTHDPLQAAKIIRELRPTDHTRHDGDYCDAIFTRGVGIGKARTARAWARNTGQMNPESAGALEQRRIRQFQSAAWLTWRTADCDTLHCAPDATRLGQPPEETLAMPTLMMTGSRHVAGLFLAPRCKRVSQSSL